jgi:hypothetical protein
LTEAEKADPTQYEPGELVQFHQNAAGGYTKGQRLIVGDEAKPPTELAQRFEVYRPVQLALAAGDRIRITATGKTKDGQHRLANGALVTVQGFTKQGDIVVDHGWVIGQEFGHLTHGYAITSHASQGVTVDKVFVGMANESFAATDQRTAYVALTRAREQAQLFTNDRKELLKAVSRSDEPLSATELSKAAQEKEETRRGGPAKRTPSRPGLIRFGGKQPGPVKELEADRELDHER